MNVSLHGLFQRPIAYLPIVAKATGSVKLTVMWSQINYWTDKARDPEGWVYKTQAEMFEETGLSRKEQETARDLGAKIGVLSSDVRGTPPTVHYRVHRERMAELIERFEKGRGVEVKERKVKASNTIAYLRDIPEDDIAEIADKFSVSTKCVRDRAQDVIDYCEAKGRTYRDYKAALRNFVKMHIERHPDAVVSRATIHTVEKTIDDRPRLTEEQRQKATIQLQKMRDDLARKKSMSV